VLSFTLIVSIATGIVFDSPGLQASRLDIITALKSEGACSIRVVSRLRALFVNAS